MALIALAKKLLMIASSVLRTGIQWNSEKQNSASCSQIHHFQLDTKYNRSFFKMEVAMCFVFRKGSTCDSDVKLVLDTDLLVITLVETHASRAHGVINNQEIRSERVVFFRFAKS